MRLLLGHEYASFLVALEAKAPVSVRLNPRKRWEGWTTPPFAEATAVPWCSEGWYLPERPVFTLDPLLHAGAYYAQEASSMFLDEVVRRCAGRDQPLRVLDLCAAPGGKTTLLQSVLPEGSWIVANEVVRSRLGALRENIERWGGSSVAIVSAVGEQWEAVRAWFDMVVVDAPCSGEGLFRKNPEAVREWSPAHVEACALRQRHILSSAVHLLKPGGLLVYSTCTFNRQENEENAEWLIRSFSLEPVVLSLPAEWGIVQEDLGTYRFFPHRLQGEGFFVGLFRRHRAAGRTASLRAPTGFRQLQPVSARALTAVRYWLKEPDTWAFFLNAKGEAVAVSRELLSDLRLLENALPNAHIGCTVGRFKGSDFIPNHALALHPALSPDVPAVALTLEQALRFLKKEQFDLPGLQDYRGWVVARFRGLGLGWLKVLPQRWNNYLPPTSRIRMTT